MKIVTVIPAKLGAKRFPNKPLVDICGVPMIGHIYARASRAKEVLDVYVAAHDKEILDYVLKCGGKGALENNSQKNAVSGAYSIIPEIEKNLGESLDWIIMVQGDEPMIVPEIIDELAAFIKAHPDLEVVNIIDEIRSNKEYHDPNVVKVILNLKGEGEWFFRVPSPRWDDKLAELPIKKQTGIIAFRKDFLSGFCMGDKTPMEKLESVDMFRLIEQGKTLPTIASKSPLYSVDTEEDRRFVEELMGRDEDIKGYAARFKR